MDKSLRLRVRLDYRSPARGRFLLGGRNSLQAAEELREQKINLLRNLPIQGVEIEDVNMELSAYVLYDEARGAEVAYAPVVLTVRAEGPEDLLRFVFWEEFRKIEVLEPAELVFTKQQLERFLFKIGENVREVRVALERRLAGR